MDEKLEKYFEEQAILFGNEDSDESMIDFAKRLYLSGCQYQAERGLAKILSIPWWEYDREQIEAALKSVEPEK